MPLLRPLALWRVLRLSERSAPQGNRDRAIAGIQRPGAVRVAMAGDRTQRGRRCRVTCSSNKSGGLSSQVHARAICNPEITHSFAKHYGQRTRRFFAQDDHRFFARPVF